MNTSVRLEVGKELELMNSTLSLQIYELEQTISVVNEKPAAHLHGSGTYGYYSSGTVTQWYTSSGSTWSPFIRGGMQYKDGVITVPTSGIYYVYVQMNYKHYSSTSYRSAGFRIRVNGSGRAYAYRYHQQPNDYHTHYMGRIIQLNNNDKLSITFDANCRYYFNSEFTFFGVFFAN
ncbi:lymphotoxin-alpha-like [Corticium candelabrum]|uniref:lymphotoxin-alpha-like n=1 Tax=Corticium candelabrum TaxID=121492 RepID=UPI002E2525F2|nr:lymphotoxin-alpha-like [Corticium candelabrum]